MTYQENKKNLGQFFTPEHVADFMISLSSVHKKADILEPCCGKGVFLKILNNRGYKNIIGYEIDITLKCEVKSNVIFRSFIGEKFNKKFDLIIGNPPYIRWKNLEDNLKREVKENFLWKKYLNSLCDYLCIFILKSIELLKDKGELIFITPEYWINTKNSQVLRDYMIANGYFEKIYHFSETPIFENVASSIIIFKYIKTKELFTKKPKIAVAKYHSSKKLTAIMLENFLNEKSINDHVEYLRINQFSFNKRWVLVNSDIEKKLTIFENKCSCKSQNLQFPQLQQYKYYTLGDIVDIGNGMVSGLDRAFQISKDIQLNADEEKSIIQVIKAKDISPFYHGEITRYIFIRHDITEKQFCAKYPNFYHHLKDYKTKLLKRYNYNRDIKYWEWAFPRSYNLFSKKQERIFVPCKERISNKDFFRFSFVESGIYPTQDVTAIFLKHHTKESIFYILALLNNCRVFEWLKYKGVVKGNIVEFSENPLASIPIRLINWEDKKEVDTHNEISSLCEKYIKTKNDNLLSKINKIIDSLF